MPAKRFALALGLLSLISTMGVGVASAADEPTVEAEARELFERGQVAYRAGDYEKALPLWRSAYELSGRAALLFNLAQVYGKLGRLHDEQASLAAFLASGEAPEGVKENAEGRLRLIEHRIALESRLSGESTEALPHEGDPRELFERGQAAYHGGQYEEAVEHWLLAYRLSGRAQLLYNLAQAYSRLGMIEEEKATLEYLLEARELPAELRENAGERLHALEQRLARTKVEIAGGVEGAEVFIDGELVGVLPLAGPLKVSPGAHRISASAEGYVDAVATVVVRAGNTAEVELLFEKIEVLEVGGRRVSKPALGLFVSGGALLAGGGILGGLAYGRANGTGRGTPEAEAAKGMALGADVLLAAGAAAVIGGVVAQIIHKRRARRGESEQESEQAPSVALTPVQGGALFVFQRGFQ